MGVCDEIIEERDGVVHCYVSSQLIRDVAELARRLGLRDDLECYREIGESLARGHLRLILHQDLAYHSEIMSAKRAAELADRFLEQFGSPAKYFTNGIFHEEKWGASWNSVTNATFDTGVLVLGQQASGGLWVEDED
jgi:hypothetical protein